MGDIVSETVSDAVADPRDDRVVPFRVETGIADSMADLVEQEYVAESIIQQFK